MTNSAYLELPGQKCGNEVINKQINAEKESLHRKYCIVTDKN